MRSIVHRTTPPGVVLMGLLLALGFGELRSPAHAQQTPALSTQAVAERLLAASPGAVGGVANREVAASLWVGAWPPDLSLDVPTPPGSQLLGSVRYQTADDFSGPPWTFAVLDAPTSMRTVYAFYMDALGALGWEPPPATPLIEARGGFSSPAAFSPVGPFTPEASVRLFGRLTFCEPEDNGSIEVTGLDRGDQSEVRLIITPASERPGRNIECALARQQTRTDLPVSLAPRILPQLQLPEDIRAEAVPSSTSSGMGSADTVAHAVTDRPLDHLAGVVADQLLAAGWHQTNAGMEAHLAWSTWEVPFGDDVEDRGWLLVGRIPGTERVSIEVRQESAEAGDERWLPVGSTTSVTRPAPGR